MPYLRFTRDRRGYEHTYLMHVGGPGEKPRVLYWYRTAPGVRVGRPALDEDAIRLIEEQHPDIEFDWTHILEIGAMVSPEVEPRIEPRKRKGRREDGEPGEAREGRGRRDGTARGTPPPPPGIADHLGAEADPEDELMAEPVEAAEGAEVAEPPATPARPSDFDEDAVRDVSALPRGGLLEELVGIGIATRLRARYAELRARLHEAPGEAMTQEEWATRLEAINPDAWVTPDEVLHGVQRSDRLFDQLRREIVGG